ncbi:MAG: acyl carrier protein [Bacteroidales bacterium]|nr:acyl carrier protein [Bacteroidales bacterium]
MEQHEIKQRVVDIIARLLEVESTFLLPDTRLQEDISASSLDRVEILINLEREFNIFINDEEAEKLHTVGDIVNLVEKKLGK